MLPVPAAMALISERVWALPRWLRWLPEIKVEGHALPRASPQPAYIEPASA
jgi:RND superfamily putative drug exporter